ncbi:Peptidase family M48 [Fibrobacter sp. UWB13]|nr:Peptidase family M48 [Fibrobacter sp. UWB13]
MNCANISVMLLYILLCLEIALRVAIEVRERRLTQLRGGVFAVLRLIPLINDIVPLPENRREPQKSQFVEKHEEGHRVLRHSILRNLMKVAFLMVAVWFLAAMVTRWNVSFFESILWLHLVAIPFRYLFNWYCWTQEFEADAYAFKELGKQKAKAAMQELAECEIPYTKLFASIYREHPTVALRSQRMLKKVINSRQ